MIIKAAKRIFNSDKICCSYSDLNFGVTFLEHSVVIAVFYCTLCHKRCTAALDVNLSSIALASLEHPR